MYHLLCSHYQQTDISSKSIFLKAENKTPLINLMLKGVDKTRAACYSGTMRMWFSTFVVMI
ncbi:MAG: hypothetical protein ABI970_18955, partial [Chloroflexota bacterium]